MKIFGFMEGWPGKLFPNKIISERLKHNDSNVSLMCISSHKSQCWCVIVQDFLRNLYFSRGFILLSLIPNEAVSESS